jgi:hypothetical protein
LDDLAVFCGFTSRCSNRTWGWCGILWAFGADTSRVNDERERKRETERQRDKGGRRTLLQLAEKIKAKRDEALQAKRKTLKDEGKWSVLQQMLVGEMINSTKKLHSMKDNQRCLEN